MVPQPSGGRVLNVQRFCLHDGPGIRTTVFLQGCPLHCWWCHNPESQPVEPALAIDPARCVRCGACLDACPERPPDQTDPQLPYVSGRCSRCGSCVSVCPTAGRELLGGRRSVAEVLAEVLADRAYFDASGGGVTLSGGEPLLQPEFLVALLARCREHGLHTALDTSGFAPWERLAAAARLADLVLYDVKAVDDATHRQATGVSSRPILDNLRRLAAVHPAIWVRVPVVPGLNDGAEAMLAIAELLRPLGAVRRVELLPYHPLGQHKRHDGAPIRTADPPTPERMADLARALQDRLPSVPVHGG